MKYRHTHMALTANPIPYNKVYRTITKSVTSAILFQQLEYWFGIMKSNKFYKYINRPNGTLPVGYKEGDSWCEELGFSYSEFKTAFNNIGQVWKSKKQFDDSEDKFQGKMYCLYHNRIDYKTYFLRNQELVEHNLTELLIRPYLDIQDKDEVIVDEKFDEKFEEFSIDTAIPSDPTEIGNEEIEISEPKRKLNVSVATRLTSHVEKKEKQNLLKGRIKQFFILWNNICAKKLHPISINQTEGRNFDIAKRCLELRHDLREWQEIFTKIVNNDYCTGKSKSKWSYNFSNLGNEEKLQALIYGEYDSFEERATKVEHVEKMEQEEKRQKRKEINLKKQKELNNLKKEGKLREFIKGNGITKKYLEVPELETLSEIEKENLKTYGFINIKELSHLIEEDLTLRTLEDEPLTDIRTKWVKEIAKTNPPELTLSEKLRMRKVGGSK